MESQCKTQKVFIMTIVYSFINSFIHSLIRSFIYWFIHPFITFIHSIIHLFIHPSIHPSIRLFQFSWLCAAILYTRISIQSIWIADYACILTNKRGNVVDSINHIPPVVDLVVDQQSTYSALICFYLVNCNALLCGLWNPRYDNLFDESVR